MGIYNDGYMSRRTKLVSYSIDWFVRTPPSRACDLYGSAFGGPVTDFFYLFFKMKLRVSPVGLFGFWGFSTSAFARDLGSKTKILDFVALFGLQDDPINHTTDLL